MLDDLSEGTFEFAFKVLGDVAGFHSILMGALGDRLGLFKAIEAKGPATSAALAESTGLDERYVREWLGGMTTAGYVRFDPDAQTFHLPADLAPVLAQEEHPFFFGAMFDLLSQLPAVLDGVAGSFKTGGGVPQSSYPERYFAATTRAAVTRDANFLVQVWVPAVEGLQSRLEAGIDVADIGCGGGSALVQLARAFPKSRFWGYDIHQPNIDSAKQLAEKEGLADRVEFQVVDAAAGLDRSFDLITALDVIHDAADPAGLLSVIRRSLALDGTFLCFEFPYSEKLEENVGPMGTMLYGFSLFYCMTTSLAQGGEGLGTLGLPDSKFRKLAAGAGFSTVNEVVTGDPFNRLYEVRA